MPKNVTGRQASDIDVCGAPNQGSNADNSGDSAASPSRMGAMLSSDNVSESMDLAEDFHELVGGESAGDESYRGVEKPSHDTSLGEEAWEEYGCILWDLAASKNHAELMVFGCFFLFFVQMVYLGFNLLIVS